MVSLEELLELTNKAEHSASLAEKSAQTAKELVNTLRNAYSAAMVKKEPIEGNSQKLEEDISTCITMRGMEVNTSRIADVIRHRCSMLNLSPIDLDNASVEELKEFQATCKSTLRQQQRAEKLMVREHLPYPGPEPEPEPEPVHPSRRPSAG